MQKSILISRKMNATFLRKKNQHFCTEQNTQPFSTAITFTKIHPNPNLVVRNNIMPQATRLVAETFPRRNENKQLVRNKTSKQKNAFFRHHNIHEETSLSSTKESCCTKQHCIAMQLNFSRRLHQSRSSNMCTKVTVLYSTQPITHKETRNLFLLRSVTLEKKNGCHSHLHV